MPEEETIAAKLDAKFIELMIQELEGQSRVASVGKLPARKAEPGLSDAEAEDLFVAKDDERPEPPDEEAPLPDLDAADGNVDDDTALSTPVLADEQLADESTSVGPVPSGTPKAAERSRPSPKRRGAEVSGKVRYQISITEPDLRERVFRLGRKPTVIGRGRDADITLKDVKVSRQHVRIEVVDNRAIVTDLNSQNGTRINGRPIREQELISGDVIEIGSTRISIQRARE